MKHLLFIFVTFFIVEIDSCEKLIKKNSYDKEIFDLINEYRKSVGLDILEFNEIIWKEANNHSKNMAEGKVRFGHDGFSERIFNIKKEFGGYSSAENISAGYPTARSVVDGWLISSRHKENIEGNYTHSAISAVRNNIGEYYYTQIFINK